MKLWSTTLIYSGCAITGSALGDIMRIYLGAQITVADRITLILVSCLMVTVGAAIKLNKDGGL